MAAIAPVCGEGDWLRTRRIAHLPVWAFHGGGADTVVPLDGHRKTIDSLREAGGTPRLTVDPGVGHDAWTPAYAEPGLYDWLLAQRRQPR